MEIENRNLIERRWQMMRQEQLSWVPGWRDIQRFINPTRGFFYEAIPNWGRTIDHKSQLSGAPNRAARIMAAGMRSGLASPSRPWFKLGLENQDLMELEPVKEYLELCQERMMSVFAKSNIYGELHAMYEEIGTFGTACAMVLDDYDTVVRMHGFTSGEYFLGQDPTGRVNSFGRYYNMTVGQLVEEYGIENVSPQVSGMYKSNKNMDSWIKVCHLIEPNDNRLPDRKDFKNKAFRSVTWEFGSSMNLALRVGGFDEFPIVAPRWQKTTTSFIYGWGPGHYSLGDVKTLMQMKKDYLVAVAKVNNPPMQADGTVQGEMNLLPNGITRTSATTPNAGIRPAYEINPQLENMHNAMDRLKEEIDENFFVQLFTMLANSDNGRMTAYEVSKRYEEKLNLLGPVIEHLESELHNPLIEITFQKMLEKGVIPPPPEEIQGENMKIEYISMLSQAQKLAGTLSIERTMAFVGNLVGVYPEVKDVVDADETVIKYGDLEGVPRDLLRTKEEIFGIRQQREQQAQAQAQAEMAQQLAQGAKTLSETPLGTGSALDAITGNTAVSAQAEK